MKIHSPQGIALPASVEAVARPASLQGLRVALLDNTKAPVDRMMAHLEGLLRERIPGVQPFYLSKKLMLKPAEPEVMAELLEYADVLITGLAD